jgi:hypothetical protein
MAYTKPSPVDLETCTLYAMDNPNFKNSLRSAFVAGKGDSKSRISDDLEKLIVGFYQHEGMNVVKQQPKQPGQETSYAIYHQGETAPYMYVNMKYLGPENVHVKPSRNADYATRWGSWTKEKFILSFSMLDGNKKVDYEASQYERDRFFETAGRDPMRFVYYADLSHVEVRPKIQLRVS